MWRRTLINEANGGAPNESAWGQAMRRFRTFPHVRSYARITSGVHPASTIEAANVGAVGRGVGFSSPLIARKFYAGALPLSQQPKIRKPKPWLS